MTRQIKAEERIVAFVDILGFSNMIKEYDRWHKEEILQNLHDAVHTSIPILQHSFPAGNDYSRQWDVLKYLEVKLFSDCLCLSSPAQHETLNFYYHFRFFYMYLATFLVVLMEKGYFARGGITVGSYYSDDLMIFSGGLVEAYELEKLHAGSPRILVSEKIPPLLQPFIISDHVVSLNRMLVIDKADNRIFINPFNYLRVTAPDADKMVKDFLNRTGIPGLINTFEETEREGLEELLRRIQNKVDIEKGKTTDSHVLGKYRWLESLLDYSRSGEELNFKCPY